MARGLSATEVAAILSARPRLVGVVRGFDMAGFLSKRELEGLVAGSVQRADIAPDAIRLELPLPVLTEAQLGLAADAVGVKYTSAYTFLVSADMLHSAKAAYLEADIEASHADSVTAVELYDATALTVRGAAAANAGDRVRSADLLASLVAGNEHQVRINVTTASATVGATTGVRRAALVLIIGIS